MDRFLDVEVYPKQRYTKADVLTVIQATRSGKSSKTHKLKMNMDRGRDSTRYDDARVRARRDKLNQKRKDAQRQEM